MCRYICPVVLLALIVSGIVSDADKFEHGYKNAPTWAHCLVGLGCVALPLAVLVIFVVWPGLWEKLDGKYAPQKYEPTAEELQRELQNMARLRSPSCFSFTWSADAGKDALSLKRRVYRKFSPAWAEHGDPQIVQRSSYATMRYAYPAGILL